MTLWQTLLIAVAPVLITATALVTQQALNVKAAQRAAELERTARRSEKTREEARSAHLAASRPLALIWDSLWVFHRATAALRVAEPPGAVPPFGVPTDLFDEFNQAFDACVLACSEDSAQALEAYGESLKRLGGVLTGGAALDEVERALDRASSTRSAYFRLARADLGHAL